MIDLATEFAGLSTEGFRNILRESMPELTLAARTMDRKEVIEMTQHYFDIGFMDEISFIIEENSE